MTQALIQLVAAPALAAASGAGEVQRVARAAGDFFLEGLSTFEMVQRGLREAHQAVSHARRQTELSRRLSTFLADASLALDASDSLDEVLQLVTEQARELLGAECCLATVASGGRPRAPRGAGVGEGEGRERREPEERPVRGARREGGPVRERGDE